MTTPILNNGLASLAHNRLASAEAREKNGQARPEAENVADSAQGDAVTVSGAGMALSKAETEQPNARVLSAEHAARIAEALKNMFAENGGAALTAQANNASPDLVQLLTTR